MQSRCWNVPHAQDIFKGKEKMNEEGREQEMADTRRRVVRALDAAAWWFRIDLLASFSTVSIAGRVDQAPRRDTLRKGTVSILLCDPYIASN